jgi:hypothetical protein
MATKVATTTDPKAVKPLTTPLTFINVSPEEFAALPTEIERTTSFKLVEGQVVSTPVVESALVAASRTRALTPEEMASLTPVEAEEVQAIRTAAAVTPVSGPFATTPLPVTTGEAEAHGVAISWAYSPSNLKLVIAIIAKPFFFPIDVVSRSIWEHVTVALEAVREALANTPRK